MDIPVQWENLSNYVLYVASMKYPRDTLETLPTTDANLSEGGK